MQAVCVPGGALGRQVLQGALEGVERIGVDQLAQLDVAQELAKLRRVDGKGLGPPLGQRRVTLVEEVRHVAEHQGGGEGRRGVAVHGHHPDAAALHVAQEPDQGRHVERVPQAFAVGLEDDGERVVIAPPLPGGRPRACAAATGATAGPDGAAAAAAPAPPPRGSGRRRARPPSPLPRRAGGAPVPSCRITSASTSSGSGSIASRGGGSSASGKRATIPSSAQRTSWSAWLRARAIAAMAIAHGAWTRPPNGLSTQTRQSPISSR